MRISLQEHGALDFVDAGISAIHQAKRQRPRTLAGQCWTLALYISGGIRLQTFVPEEEARSNFCSRSSSKVLFDACGHPVECSTAPSDPSGLGVALIFKLLCGDCAHSELSAAEAVKVPHRKHVT